MELFMDSHMPIEVLWPGTEGLKNQHQTTSGDKMELSDFEIIDTLFNRKLKQNIFIKIEEDGDAFIAYMTNMLIYGYGNTPKQAIESIRHQIELCYEELNEDDDFSQEWIDIKRYLHQIID